MQGIVFDVKVADGDAVEAGQVLCIVEAMKMENEVHAHRDGVVSGLAVRRRDWHGHRDAAGPRMRPFVQ